MFNLNSSGKASTSDDAQTRRFWKEFWKTKAVPKEKICARRSILNILPTHVNIVNKDIDTNHLCFLCRGKVETGEHVMWTCKMVRSVWCYFFPILQSVLGFFKDGWNAMDRWAKLQKVIKVDEIPKAFNISWCIWNFRNQIKNTTAIPDPTNIIRTVTIRCRDEKSTCLLLVGLAAAC